MAINPYLFFNGNCAEAFDYYRSVFGSDYIVRQTYADGPDDFTYPDGLDDKIMHVSLPIGSVRLMGADTAPGFGTPPEPTTAFALSYAASSREDADRIMAALSHNGEVKMAMQDTFWGSYFGMCTDQFGVQWMINMDLHTPN